MRRPASQRLSAPPAHTRVPWDGRAEDKTDADIWAMTCFVTRADFRRRGISRALDCAAVDFTRERGALALEEYLIITRHGREMMAVEVHVGCQSISAPGGFAQVSNQTVRRVVMCIDV